MRIRLSEWAMHQNYGDRAWLSHRFNPLDLSSIVSEFCVAGAPEVADSNNGLPCEGHGLTLPIDGGMEHASSVRAED